MDDPAVNVDAGPIGGLGLTNGQGIRASEQDEALGRDWVISHVGAITEIVPIAGCARSQPRHRALRWRGLEVLDDVRRRHNLVLRLFGPSTGAHTPESEIFRSAIRVTDLLRWNPHLMVGKRFWWHLDDGHLGQWTVVETNDGMALCARSGATETVSIDELIDANRRELPQRVWIESDS